MYDPQEMLEDYITSIDNLPAEIQFIFKEILEKDVELDKLKEDVKGYGLALKKDGKEEEILKKIQEKDAKAKILQLDKIKLAERAQELMDIKIKKLSQEVITKIEEQEGISLNKSLNPILKISASSISLKEEARDTKKTTFTALKRSKKKDNQVYCYCRNISYGEMIGCDNEDCRHEWFHLDCVGLIEPPRGVWFCPDCLANGSNGDFEEEIIRTKKLLFAMLKLIFFAIFVEIVQGWSTKTFAPYVDVANWPTLDVSVVAKATGVKHFTLAFIVADQKNQPAWAGVIPLSNNFYASQIASLRALGGDIIISFGGATGKLISLRIGSELGSRITDPSKLAAAYQSVIDQYKVTAVDFDIEGAIISNKVSVDSRNIALKILKQNNPKLRISYTLPVSPNGLDANAYYLLTSAVKNGATIDVINLMTMDFGTGVAPNGATGMGGYSISAATAVNKQIQQAGMKATVGICPMIGKNDVPTEIFRLEDALQVLQFGQKNSWVSHISFWSVNRDTATYGPLYISSQISQKTYDFCNTFKAFELEAPLAISPTPIPAPIEPVIAKPVPSPEPVIPAPVPLPTGFTVGYNWPKRVFAPYLNVWNNPENFIRNVSQTIGVVRYTVAFVVADKYGNPSFDGSIPLASNFLYKAVSALRLFGGDIIVSFGGASGNEIAIVTSDVKALQQKYQNIVDQYSLSWLDFDIEGNGLLEYAANDRRNAAIAAMQRNNPFLRISYTLPVETYGLLESGLKILLSAKKAGVRVDVVNIMTMNFGSQFPSMGDGSICAANAVRIQLVALGFASTTIGITPMIGQNDIKTQIFNQEDAKKVTQFAKQTPWVSYIGLWSIQRDNNRQSTNLDSSSNIRQDNLAFSKTFLAIEN